MSKRRRVVVVGGGAAGTLTTVQLLRQGGPGLVVTVVEPRPVLGRGVAFGTPDPWHRLNVPAITMSGLPDEPEHFRAHAGVAPDDFPPRQAFGRYLGDLLEGARAASAATFEHLQSRATGVRDGSAGDAPALVVELDDGRRLEADGVVLATGNELPRVPAFARGLVTGGAGRFVADPWTPGSLDRIDAGSTVGIIGTGHTALDLAASLLRGRGVARVVAMSRHGETPHAHEVPWRPRPPEPAFGVDEFAAWADKPAEVRRRLAAYPLGWRQGLDSIRPILRELWLAMTEAERHALVARDRREWEIHRSRLAPEVARDVAAWVAEGRLEVRAGGITATQAAGDAILVHGDAGTLEVAWLLLATGPDESPAASPVLAATMGAGLARPGSQDLGIDVHPYDYRVLDAAGGATRELYALGPIIRGSVWESIAVPEIRQQAARIAAQLAG